MLVKFKASKTLKEYHGKPSVDFIDGEQKEVSEEKGSYLLKTFPANFSRGLEDTKLEEIKPKTEDPTDPEKDRETKKDETGATGSEDPGGDTEEKEKGEGPE